MLPIRNYFGGLGNHMFQGAYLYAQVREGKIPDIYVQDFKYFEPYKDEIRKMYQEGIPALKDRVALHLRRGDYVNNPFYVDLTKTDYYQNAIKEFPNEKFLLFCADRQGANDPKDREWCVSWATELGIPFELYQGIDEIDDMNAMASCKGQILANSTFSMWAAFINPYAEKIVAPKQYYTDGKERTVFPTKNWIML